MPTLGNALDLAKYEARNLRAHQLGTAPSSPVTGQLYYNTADNTLYWWDGTVWQSAKGGAPGGAAGGDLSGTYPNPQIAAGVIVDADVAAANKDGAVGTPSLRTLGVGAQQAAAGNDTRFTNARTPTAHATTHQPGGSDPMAVDAAAATASLRTLGTGATQAAPGNDARFGSGGPPTGAASGDLSGTYPSPQIASGVLVDTDFAAAHRDGVVSTQSLRTLGSGAQQAMPGNRTLDAINAPVGNVNMGGQRIISLAATPVGGSDATSKTYVDTEVANAVQGLDAKASVKCATVGNITLSGTQTIDNISVIAGQRVLVKDQTSQPTNGIYVVAAGAWTRATDADTAAELVSAFVFVEEGSTNMDTGWVCQIDAGGTLGTTNVPWTQFSGAGQVVAGAALTKSGNTLDVNADDSSIVISGDQIEIGPGGVQNTHIGAGQINLDDGQGKVTGVLGISHGGTSYDNAKAAREQIGGIGASGYYSSATHGAGTTISITQATHQLRATRGLIVQVQEEATGAVVLPDVVVAANGNVTVTFGASVSANAYRVTVIG